MSALELLRATVFMVVLAANIYYNGLAEDAEEQDTVNADGTSLASTHQITAF